MLNWGWSDGKIKLKSKKANKVYGLTHGIPWSVYSCLTGQLLLPLKQQFNDIDSALVALFAFLVFCHFKKCNISYPHSSTIISRITVIYFFLSFIHRKFPWKLEITHLEPDWYNFFDLVCLGFCFISFNQLINENVVWDNAKSLNTNFSPLSRYL